MKVGQRGAELLDSVPTSVCHFMTLEKPFSDSCKIQGMFDEELHAAYMDP